MNATRQSPRTYALTIVTHERRRLFQVTANAQLMTDLILRYRAEQKILLHAFVIMPDHLHVLLTPTESIERTAQLLKGGFSFAARATVSKPIWQDGYHEHRIRDVEDYDLQKRYIENNPTRKGHETYAHIHTQYLEHIDPPMIVG